MPTSDVKVIRASQILKKTINDFTRHPDHWVQNTFGTKNRKVITEEQEAAWEDQLQTHRGLSPKVTEPGNGKYTTFGIYAFDDILGDPEQYCGLGGIQANAYKLNKKHFWHYKFQTELGIVGAYLNAEAKRRQEAVRTYFDYSKNRYVDEPITFDGFVSFNDHRGRTVQEVIDLFKVVLKQLKVREARLAARREAAAAARAAA